MRYLWWGVFGASVGGWLSALLAWQVVLAPVLAPWSANIGPGLVALACHAHSLVLAGRLMGMASGVCLARRLYLRPIAKAQPAALVLAVMVTVGCLPWLEIFSGSVAGLQIDTHGVAVTSMDVLPRDQKPDVPVGQGVLACGPRGGTLYQSFRDGARVVSLSCCYLRFPWRWGW